MIEKILSELQELPHGEYTDDYGKGFSAGINAAMKIVQEVAKEYGTARDNDLAVVSSLPSLYPLQKFEEEAIHKVVASAKDGGWISCSGCSDCQHKECKHYGKV